MCGDTSQLPSCTALFGDGKGERCGVTNTPNGCHHLSGNKGAKRRKIVSIEDGQSRPGKGVHRTRRIPYRRPACTQSDMSLLTMVLVRRFLRQSLQNLVGKTLGVRVEGFLSLRGRMGSYADHTEWWQRL